jgi:hypothetical protein
MTHHDVHSLVILTDSCTLATSVVLSIIKGTRKQGLLLFAACLFFLGGAIYVEGPYDRRWEYFLDSLGMAFAVASVVLTSAKWFRRSHKELV